ncbi:MAG: efflux RND transporter periplasmic adaptor subunit [Acidobacteriota bacterium]
MVDKLKKIAHFLNRRRVPIVISIVLIGAAIVVAAFWNKGSASGEYLTGKIERGNIEVTVSATGTVQAVTTVQVGSQVSGTVAWLGADFNSRVKKGQIVAKLDPAIFQTQVQNQEANLLNANAAVQAAMTELNNQKANMSAARANQEVTRVQRDDALALVKRYEELKNVLSGRDLEAARAQASAAAARYEQATAQIGQAQAAQEIAQARLQQSKAAVEQAKAQLNQAKVNLEHTIIASPIDGVVVSRNVDVGQTVAASLQAPTLFTIANDLTSMQVLASIDEADVGQIRTSQKANFTVDTHQGQIFSGEISQIRLNAQTLQNVVTYTAVIAVSNPEQKLLPGMTANITIPVARRDNVLMIPNAALRFKPNLSEQEQQELRQKMEERRQQREQQREGEARGRGDAGDASSQRPAASPDGQKEGQQQGQGQRGGRDQSEGGQRRPPQTIWVLTGAKKIEPRFIRTGITNGRMTEIIGGDIQEGDVIVTGQNEPNGTNPSQPTGSPFGQRPGFGPGRR